MSRQFFTSTDLLLLLSLGCRVLAFEPQPACVKMINAAVHFNRFESQVTVIPHPVSSEKTTMKVSPETGCNTQFPVSEDKKKDQAFQFKNFEMISTISLDEALAYTDNIRGEHILLLKIDTEGYEATVLKSGLQLAKTRQLKNMIMEVSPALWRNNGFTPLQVARTVREFAEAAQFDLFDVITTKTRLASLEELEDFLIECNFQDKFKQVDIWLHRKSHK